MDVEIYISEISTDDAIRWVSSKLGRLDNPLVEDGITYLRSEHGVSVVLTPKVEEGPFSSVTLRGNELPWKTSTQFAKDCARDLGRPVRAWDDDDEQWLETDGVTEAQIVWEEDG